MKYLLVEGDLQNRSDYNEEYNTESIHYLASCKYTRWVISNPKLNNEETGYFSLGDMSETSNPNPRDTSLMFNYLLNLKSPKKFILAGNHDYNRDKNTYSFDPLLELSDVEAFKKPTELELGNCKFKILPHFYDNIYQDLKSMKEEYEGYTGDYDFIFTHIADETQDFGGGHGIDISKLKGTRLQGHIHTGGKGYVTSPLPHKSSEVLDHRYLYKINLETKEVEEIEIPKFMTYESVKYPEPVDFSKLDCDLVNLEIRDYVNKEEAYNFYKEQFEKEDKLFFVYKMIKKRFSENGEEDRVRSDKVRSIKEIYLDFKRDKKLNPNVANIMEQYIH